MLVELRVTPDGSVLVNGGRVTPARAEDLVRTVGETIPYTSHLVLEIDDASDCRIATRLRDQLDGMKACHQGYCSEARRWNEWRRDAGVLDLPAYALRTEKLK